MVLGKLNSMSYKSARRQLKENDYRIKRLRLLCIRVLTRIEKINIYLGNDELEDKELKTKISLLSQLMGVKKQIDLDIVESETKVKKEASSLSNINDILKS